MAKRQARRSKPSRQRAPRKSASHVKGWRTRRANAAKRAAAAKKGWRTRRANAKKRPSPKRPATKAPPKITRRPLDIEPERVEYAVSADYDRPRKGRAVSVQLSVFGPSHVTISDVEAAVNHKINWRKDPDGYEIKIVDWNTRPKNQRIDQSQSWRAFQRVLMPSTLHVRKGRKT